MTRGQTRVAVRSLVAARRPEWSSEQVDEAIRAGRFLVDGGPVQNPAARVPAGAALRELPEPDLAGRRKLAWAIERFGVDAAGRVALDVGASTGGFTTAWLEAGAARVYAVDVGYGQLLGSLRQDPRVVNLERTNVSALDGELIGEPLDALSVDVSYLALAAAVDQLKRLAFRDGAELLGLVKPMFELRLPTIPTDQATLAHARDTAIDGVARAGWTVVDVDECPVHGAKGAVEFVLHARRMAPKGV